MSSSRRIWHEKASAVTPDASSRAQSKPHQKVPHLTYICDSSLEGVLSAIFAAYANKQFPEAVKRDIDYVQDFWDTPIRVDTNVDHAMRVAKKIKSALGWNAWNGIRRASCSSAANAPTAIYDFVCHSLSSPSPGTQYGNIMHPSVEPLFKLSRSVSQECEHMRQFARFQHLKVGEGDVWFAKVNPRDSVVPLVMRHFVERFNVQPFILYDEVHDIAGVYTGASNSNDDAASLVPARSDCAMASPAGFWKDDWQLVDVSGFEGELGGLAISSSEEVVMQEAWKRFYKVVSIDVRYNPELRRHFMPKRFYRNLTEMQD